MRGLVSPTALLADPARLRLVIAHEAAADEYREVIVARWGRRALVSLNRRLLKDRSVIADLRFLGIPRCGHAG